MRPQRTLAGGFGATLLAVLGVVLLAFLTLNLLTGRWTQLSTVIAKRGVLLQRVSLHLGFAALHFQKYIYAGGSGADRFASENRILRNLLDAYRATGPLTAEEQRLIDNAGAYLDKYQRDMKTIKSIRAIARNNS